MITLPSRKLKIVLCCTAASLLMLGAVVAFQTVDRNDQDETVSAAAPVQVRDLSKTLDVSAVMPQVPDDRSTPTDESATAQARIENLKKKLRSDHTDFGRMKRDLEERLSRAPDGKITPEEILAVIPPEHREEFKSVITSMYAEQNKPMTMKETQR